MNTHLVLSFVGKDRPGLLQCLTNIITSFDGSWQESHMRQMAGLFAGMALVVIEAGDLDAVLQELQGIEDVTVVAQAAPGSEPLLRMRGATLNLVGPDRTGMLDSVIHELSLRGANVLEVDTHLSAQGLGSARVFIADIVLEIPDTVDVAGLDKTLTTLGEGLGLEMLLEHLDDD